MRREVVTERVEYLTSNVAFVTLEEDLLAPPQTVEQAERELPAVLSRRAPPPERMTLSVPEVRQAALQNNLGLKVELYRPAIENERLAKEQAKFEPSAFLRGSAGENDPPPTVSPFTETLTSSGELGLRLPLRTGGSTSVSLRTSGTNIDRPGTPNNYDSTLAFVFTQPLLRGGGVDVNEASITIVELQQSQQLARTKAASIRILAAADSAYWRHYSNERTLEVRFKQYEQALEQERQARRLSEAGALAAIEVTRAKLGVSRRIESIIVAENERRETERELKRVMNLPNLGINTKTAIITETEPQPLRLEPDVDVLAENAVEERMEILELELQAAIDAVTIGIAENQELPELNVEYGFSYLGNGNTVNRALDQAFQRNYSDWNISANLNVPLGNKAATAERRQAVLQRALTLSTKNDRALTIRKEVYDTADRLTRAWQLILAARQERLFAAETYEGERKLFQQGVQTSTDVLQALGFLADARVREIQALAGYEIAKIDIALATGNLLGYGNIEIKPPESIDRMNKEMPYEINSGGIAQAKQYGKGKTEEILSDSLLNRVSAIVKRHTTPVDDDYPAEVAAGVPLTPRNELVPTTRRPAAEIFVGTTIPVNQATNRAVAIVKPATPATPDNPQTIATGRSNGFASYDPSMYTVQVLSSTDEEAVQAFIRSGKLATNEITYVANDVNGSKRYAVVYGLYPTRSAAAAAAQSLPAEIKNAQPWVRRVGQVQQQMNN
jgi:outer membrane protein